jgi:Zn-dependent protease with chaperone function
VILNQILFPLSPELTLEIRDTLSSAISVVAILSGAMLVKKVIERNRALHADRNALRKVGDREMVIQALTKQEDLIGRLGSFTPEPVPISLSKRIEAIRNLPSSRST